MPVIATGARWFGKMQNAKDAKVTYRKQKSLVERKQELEAVQARYPNKIPVVIEPSLKEKELPQLEKTKFLFPPELTIAQLISVMRNRMAINSSQTFFLFVNQKAMVSMSATLLDLYTKEKDDDGFLYFTYASQDAFGYL